MSLIRTTSKGKIFSVDKEKPQLVSEFKVSVSGVGINYNKARIYANKFDDGKPSIQLVATSDFWGSDTDIVIASTPYMSSSILAKHDPVTLEVGYSTEIVPDAVFQGKSYFSSREEYLETVEGQQEQVTHPQSIVIKTTKDKTSLAFFTVVKKDSNVKLMGIDEVISVRSHKGMELNVAEGITEEVIAWVKTQGATSTPVRFGIPNAPENAKPKKGQ